MIVLTFSCPDKKGIVASISKILFENDANIVESNQYSTNSGAKPHFFMRIVFEQENLSELRNINQKLAEFSSVFNAEFKLTDTSVRKKVAIFVSKEDHCLYELLWQKTAGDLFMDIVCIISNHNILLPVAESYRLPFIYAPYRDNPYQQEELIKKEFERLNLEIDFVILAKYMRVLSKSFINSFCQKIINIHHSFLPSFPGAKPYVQAYQKGVKLVGATAHFVNEKLDDGPIIEQDIIRISHADDINEIKRKGKIVEKLVLAKAVKLFTENRIIEHDNKTIIFE
ncbi:MAG: formyltetrahydrofolate deformylase [bacterium]